MGDDHYQINADEVSHAGLALVYVLLELRKKLNHHKKKRTKLLSRAAFFLYLFETITTDNSLKSTLLTGL